MTGDRIPVVAANWKMHKTLEEAREFCDVLLPQIEGSSAEVVICPPFLALSVVAEATKLGPIEVAGQNMHWEPSGAYTGEVSAAMLLDAGARAVVLGHSERRALFGETDDALARKVPAALENGLLPILCVGETAEERERDDTDRVLRRQIDAGLSRVPVERLGEVVVAYEPIWAIGTGKTASPAEAEDACGFIRAMVASRNEEAAGQIRILYGGSVKPDNARDLLGREEIDGALVGGASLDPDDFAAIVAAAE
ncbi:MAG: triose-phosphate isomerase [Solirubrobacterales bacterium]|nr:triose-phosphate isomerase [Solirubrobacterales bacterium]